MTKDQGLPKSKKLWRVQLQVDFEDGPRWMGSVLLGLKEAQKEAQGWELEGHTCRVIEDPDAVTAYWAERERNAESIAEARRKAAARR